MKTSSGLAFLCFALLVPSAWSADQYEITIERDVQAKMRDGVILRADIYRPKAEGRFPVLLQRTPYNKAASDIGVRGAARGYVASLGGGRASLAAVEQLLLPSVRT